ncbi:MAG: hypothetical protein AB8B86_16840 [Pseudomonadales bacterium]
MNVSVALNSQIRGLGFWSAIVAIATTVVSVFLPLDAPAGYTAEHAERVAWLSANRGAFIAGWLNQIVAMLSLSGLFFAIAWQIAAKNPLRAILAAMVILMSVMAFITVKFIAVWTIPLLADTITAGAQGADMADALLLMLNVTLPFSLYTSFDWLGFWLYAVFALLVARPLWGGAMSLKVVSATLAIFGIVYHAMIVTLLLGAMATVDINTYFLSASGLLLIVILAMAVHFREEK